MKSNTLTTPDEKAANISPIGVKDRIKILDILRGFAIFGIFLGNLAYFNGYAFLPDEVRVTFSTATFDKIGLFFLEIFVEGKFYSLFSFLFGIGFAVQMLRTKSKGKPFIPLYLKRIGILLLIGLLHTFLLWPGDILAVYAITAIFLIPFKDISNRIILISAAVLILSPIILYSLMLITGIIMDAGLFSLAIALSQKWQLPPPNEVIATGTMATFFLDNIAGTAFRYSELFFTSRWPKVLGMFLIGFYFGRNEIFKKVEEYKGLFKRILIYGGVIGLIFSIAMATLNEYYELYPLSMGGIYITTAYALGVHSLSLAYMAGITLLYRKYHSVSILNILAPVGRMALTNYLLQSFIGVLVFYNIGLGIGHVGPTIWIPFGIIVFILQVYLSKWWLSKFKFGPMEWIWRSAVYGKRQEFRKSIVPPVNIA